MSRTGGAGYLPLWFHFSIVLATTSVWLKGEIRSVLLPASGLCVLPFISRAPPPPQLMGPHLQLSLLSTPLPTSEEHIAPTISLCPSLASSTRRRP
ncbi:hypothetical protein GE21DRAFT_1114489 [Neurospora crassa]|nr:hypothetical protein GE21DRAFT_1114489 [Neurospora crassa]